VLSGCVRWRGGRQTMLTERLMARGANSHTEGFNNIAAGGRARWMLPGRRAIFSRGPSRQEQKVVWADAITGCGLFRPEKVGPLEVKRAGTIWPRRPNSPPRSAALRSEARWVRQLMLSQQYVAQCVSTDFVIELYAPPRSRLRQIGSCHRSFVMRDFEG